MGANRSHHTEIQYFIQNNKTDKNNWNLAASTLCYGDNLTLRQNNLMHKLQRCSFAIANAHAHTLILTKSHTEVHTEPNRESENMSEKLCLHR